MSEHLESLSESLNHPTDWPYREPDDIQYSHLFMGVCIGITEWDIMFKEFDSKQKINKLMDCLSESELQVIETRYGLKPYTPILSPEEASAKLSITEDLLEQIEWDALAKMREEYMVYPIDKDDALSVSIKRFFLAHANEQNATELGQLANIFRSNGVETVEDLTRRAEVNLNWITGITEESVATVKSLLGKYGLELAENPW